MTEKTEFVEAGFVEESQDKIFPVGERTIGRSPSIAALVAALAKAQLGFETVKKETDNPFFRSRYADLATIIGATQKALAENGIVIIQSPRVDVARQQAAITGLMAHSSGEWIESELVLPAVMLGKDGKPKFDAQACGSAQTYARRYQYQALVGVAAEQDDDANTAAGLPREGTKEAQKEVAERKIREDRAKAGHAYRATGPAPSITLGPWKQGTLSVAGDGVSILRVELSDDDKLKTGMHWDGEGKTWVIPFANALVLDDACKRVNVVMHWADKPDPIILSAEEKETAGGKTYLSVNWGGKQVSCWDRKMWGYIKTGLTKPAMFTVEKKGKYSNIVGIIHIDGKEFSGPQYDSEPEPQEAS